MNDARLNLVTILTAVNLGANVANYVEVSSLKEVDGENFFFFFEMFEFILV